MEGANRIGSVLKNRFEFSLEGWCLLSICRGLYNVTLHRNDD
jgi:hypothetical protein